MNELDLPHDWAIPFQHVIVTYSISEYSKGDRGTPAFGGEIEELNVYAVVEKERYNINDHPAVKEHDEKIKQFIYDNQ